MATHRPLPGVRGQDHEQPSCAHLLLWRAGELPLRQQSGVVVKQLFRGLFLVLAAIIVIRVLDWLLAPLFVPLIVLTVLIALLVLTIRGPGGFTK